MESDLGKLFIGGISWDTNEDRLREYFQGFGEVVEAVIMKDRNTGRARGFGFIVFADPAVAERVVMEKHLIDGRMVEAKKAVPRDDQNIISRSNASIHGSPGPTRTKKIFVGGLASTVTDTDFRRYFEQFGVVTDVVVMYDHNTQRPRGFGFITYESEDSVDKVLLKTFHELLGKMVEVKRAVPKELSPGPNMRSPIGPFNNYGMNRINSFLSNYTQGYNPSTIGGYGMRMDGRFSPLMSGRTGFPPFSPGYGIGVNFEPGMSSNFNSSLSYGRTISPYYGGNSSRIGNLGSVFSSPTRNLWGNGGLNYNTNFANSNSYMTSGSGNIGGFGNNNNNLNWGSSSPPAHGVGSVSGYTGANVGFGTGENSFGLGGSNYGRISANSGSANTSFNSLSNGYEGNYSEPYAAGGSIYGDPTWRSASSDLDGPDPFSYGLGNGTSDVGNKGPGGYAGGYNVANRQPNAGIAA